MNLTPIKDYLTEEGYRPGMDDDGDVTFKSEGKHYFIDSPADDAHFLRLVAPNLWEIESEDELALALAEANKASAGVKVAKVFVTSNQQNVWAAIEMFATNIDAFTAVFPRCLSALDTAVRDFREAMQTASNPLADETDGQIDEEETRESEGDQPILFKLFRNLCLRGDLDRETLHAYLKVLETTPDCDAAATAKDYLEMTMAEARVALESDDVDFLFVDIPDRSEQEDLEAAYRILWDKAQAADCIQSMAAVRLSMMDQLGQARQRDLIGLWTP